MASFSAFAARPFKCLQLRLEPTQRGAILWITLNRPQAFNALSMELTHELHTVLDALMHPTSMHIELPADFPRVLIIQGAGKAFSGGVDIKAADRGIGGAAWDYRDMRSQQLLSRLIEKLRQIPQPVIAAVQGAASGGGFAIAMAADLRVARRSSRFSAAFVRLGLTGCDMGTSYFAWRHMGLGAAAELLLTGREMGAERAYQLGLVNELVDDGAAEGLESAARALATDMLACSAKGLQLTKEQLGAAADGGSLRGVLAAENTAQMLLVNDPVATRAAQAWLDSLVKKSAMRSRL